MTSRFSRKLRGPEKGKADFRSRQTERDERCARTETKRRKAPDDMNAAPGFRLGRLAGLPRTCARYASSEAVAAAAAPVAAAAVAKPVAKPPPEGHGQKIWVHANRLSDKVVYSFKPAVEGFHALKQIAFAGKKSKPAKMRKDQWYPMAVISFPDGQGAVGRSAFQKLRELKRLHEVSWSGEVAYHDPSEYNVKQRQLAAERHADGETFKITRHRRHRAKAIQRQRLNSIADMAAVLAGQGSGNKVRLAAERGEEGDGEKEAERLVPVTINWADQQDREYAQQWSENVTHEEFGKPAPALETS